MILWRLHAFHGFDTSCGVTQFWYNPCGQKKHTSNRSRVLILTRLLRPACCGFNRSVSNLTGLTFGCLMYNIYLRAERGVHCLVMIMGRRKQQQHRRLLTTPSDVIPSTLTSPPSPKLPSHSCTATSKAKTSRARYGICEAVNLRTRQSTTNCSSCLHGVLVYPYPLSI